MEQFTQTLKSWRKTRRFSQLDLALEANVSARHISFLETGRARPSPEMIARLGDALHMPLAARNQMLAGAGFAARYPGRAWDTDEMAPIREAINHMLASHMPYPAIAIDRLWTVMRMNPAAAQIFGMAGLAEGGSLLDLMMSDIAPGLVDNWPEVAHHAAQRMRLESAAQGGVPELDRVADHLSAVPDAPGDALGPIVPTVFRAGDLRLSLFATIAQFGTPEDLTLDDLKIELYFPADDASKAFFHSG